MCIRDSHYPERSRANPLVDLYKLIFNVEYTVKFCIILAVIFVSFHKESFFLLNKKQILLTPITKKKNSNTTAFRYTQNMLHNTISLKKNAKYC